MYVYSRINVCFINGSQDTVFDCAYVLYFCINMSDGATVGASAANSNLIKLNT